MNPLLDILQRQSGGSKLDQEYPPVPGAMAPIQPDPRGPYIAPQAATPQAANPLLDILRRQPSQTAEPATEEFPASGGLTVAPKGGTPHDEQPFNYAAAGAGDIASRAGQNLIPSGKRFVSDIYNAVTNPVQTLTAMKNVGAGAVEKLIPGEQAHEPYANAVGQFFVDRYGGIENLKRTIAEDPVGFAADIGTLLSGGELGLARAPGVAGQIGRVAGTVSRAVDPIAGTMKAAGLAAKGAGHTAAAIEGVATGTGGSTIRQAAKTGFEGGEAGQAFRENMRGNVPMEDVIRDAKAGLGAIKQQRQAAYKAGMADVSKDQTVLDFGKIDATLAGTKPVAEFKGISLNPSAQATVQELAQVLDQWRKLDPKEFHTAEGFDALKQRIGDVVAGTKPGSPSQKIATQVYNVIKDQITKQAPTYSKTMAGYQQASDLIREMEKTLSLNPKANVDTTLRKLQSVMRNNVNTNYGKRVDLVKLLEASGAKNLMAKLAGQSASSWAPRGLAQAVAGLQTVGGVGGAFAALNPAVALPLVGTLAMQSPRVVNELAHAGGRAANALSRYVPARNALQAGYLTRADQERTRP